MKAILWILSLAIMWAVTGALVGLGVESVLGKGSWALPCGSLNLAIGMILLQIITQNEAARKLFYEGEKDEDFISIGIFVLWAIPITLAFLGIVWWIWGKLFTP